MAKKAKTVVAQNEEQKNVKTVRVKKSLADKVQKTILTYLKKYKNIDVFDERAEIEAAILRIEEKIEMEKDRQKKESKVFKKLAKFNEEDIRTYLANINN